MVQKSSKRVCKLSQNNSQKIEYNPIYLVPFSMTPLLAVPVTFDNEDKILPGLHISPPIFMSYLFIFWDIYCVKRILDFESVICSSTLTSLVGCYNAIVPLSMISEKTQSLYILYFDESLVGCFYQLDAIM